MNNLTKSSEDYIEAIYMLELKNEKIQSVKIASMLDVSKPAVNKAMAELKEKGLIDKDNYSSITLTEEGREIAKRIYLKHTTIEKFLLLLGVEKEIAEVDCCKIEHVISDETFEKIKKFCEK